MRIMTRCALRFCLALLLAVALGCAASEPAPVKVVSRPQPPPLGRRVSELLTFESAQDLVFVEGEPSGAVMADTRVARSGGSLLALPGAQSIVVKLPTLLAGRAFPGEWTLLGAYVH